MGGIGGALLLPIFRSIFITETAANWRGMTYFAIFLGIPLSLLILFTFKETQKFEEMKEKRDSGEQMPKLKENLKLLFKSARRKELIVILIVSLIAGLNYVFFRLVEAYWSGSGMSDSEINIVIYFTAISVILGYLITGIAAEKWGRKPLLYIYGVLSPISIIIVVLGINFSGVLLIIIVGVGAGLAYITL